MFTAQSSEDDITQIHLELRFSVFEIVENLGVAMLEQEQHFLR